MYKLQYYNEAVDSWNDLKEFDYFDEACDLFDVLAEMKIDTGIRVIKPSEAITCLAHNYNFMTA